MAYDLRNDVFTKSFSSGDSSEYQITLICGHHQDVVSGSEVEFPENVIFPVVNGEVGYQDDIPVGLPIGRVLSLEIDLANLKDGDWSDVSTAIVRGYSTSQRTVNGVDMYIPNVWVIAGNSQIYYYCQVPSSKEIEIDSGVAKYTIDLIGIEKPVLERLSIDMLDLEGMTPTWTITATHAPAPSNDVVNVCYDIGGSDKRFYNEEPIDGKKFYSNADFFGRIEDKAQVLQDAMLRGVFDPAPTVSISITDINDIWSFYEQDVDTNHDRGDAIDFEDLLIFGYLYGTGGDVKGGFFDPTGNGIFSYNNAWSFLRQFCDSMSLKATFGYGVTINFYPILDTISSDGDLASLDPKEYKLKPSDKYISESTSYTIGGGTGDVVNAKALSIYGSLDGASNDAEIMFNTLTLNFIDGMEAAFNDGGLEYVKVGGEISKKGSPSGRTLYYKRATGVNGRDFFKVHDDCGVNIGGGYTDFNGNSTAYGALTYPIPNPDYNTPIQNAILFGEAVNIVIGRQQYYGIGYSRARAIRQIFSNENQGIFTAKVSAQIDNTSFINLLKLGETYTIDLSAVSGIPALGEFSGKMILTNIKYDFIEGTADCTFFMRGDTLA